MLTGPRWRDRESERLQTCGKSSQRGCTTMWESLGCSPEARAGSSTSPRGFDEGAVLEPPVCPESGCVQPRVLGVVRLNIVADPPVVEEVVDMPLKKGAAQVPVGCDGDCSPEGPEAVVEESGQRSGCGAGAVTMLPEGNRAVVVRRRRGVGRPPRRWRVGGGRLLSRVSERPVRRVPAAGGAPTPVRLARPWRHG